MSEEVHETPSATPNFQTELAAQLAELMPEVIADGKVDVEKFKELLDGDATDSSERFGLFWPGKKRALRAAQEPTTATLRPDVDNSKDWDTTKNVFIEGDNLEVLKILQKHYHAKIKMIYIDPPYNTGNDFVYPDNYKEGLDTYLEWTRQLNEEGKNLSTNADTEGRYHSNWLNMMYPRLKLARNLLTPEGVIAISIDDNEAPRLRQLCDEVFGEANFVAQVVTQANKGGRDYLPLAQTHEYVLIYARRYSDAGIYELPKIDNSLRFQDGLGRYECRELRNRNPRFNRANRPNLFYPFYVDPNNVDSNGYASVSLELDDRHTLEVYPHNSQGNDSCWRWGTTKAGQNIVQGDPDASQIVAKAVRTGGWNVYEKNRRSTQKAKTIWDETEVRTEAGTREVRQLFGKSMFDHPKPVDLIKKIIALATRPDADDIVLDFFAGSGSTGHAVLAANADDSGNRRWIQVQLPEPTTEASEARRSGLETLSAVARARLSLACYKLDSELASQTIDTGFRAFLLADTSFSKWKVSSDVDRTELEQHLFDLRVSSSSDDALADDLLTEILLKQGYSLTEKIAPVVVAGLNLRTVGEGVVHAYLDEHVKPTLEQLRAVVDEDPARLIVLEDAFQGDDQLKTNLAQLCKSKGIEVWTA
ncbi:adenine-specific DNA-methyltransferase [Brevibacterium sandarakinum]|uniref:Adenine-specific DNA-methyltransferase n=1 Tax=Brevibacterium sandarakinum TaxID=629680 RepID=A0A1H1WQC3_BRESA|nr:site-specific DNA-methyltransferase [Brevibacterium sandarakinum]SDS99222.1 adenine-specific DNA-methyltransferase [Brevibacterium sandarakinum]